MTMMMKPRQLGQIAAPSAPKTIAVGEDGLTNMDALRVLFAGTLTSNRRGFKVICRHCDAVWPWANTPQLAMKIWSEGFTLRRPASHRAKQKFASNGRCNPGTNCSTSGKLPARGSVTAFVVMKRKRHSRKDEKTH